jgi:hypothetical protein
MSVPNQRQPWPMKWIVIAIVLILIPYTFLTLRYRRPGPAFRPYEDMKNRANVSRLLDAGYRRIPLVAQRPADGARTGGGAEVTAAPGGLPAELRSTLVEAPLLPVEITGAAAAPVTSALQAYLIQLTCTLPNEKQQLGGAELFVRGDTLVITPTFEPLAGALRTRTTEDAVLLTVPAGSLKSGRYTVTAVGERTSRSWMLEVK